MVPGSVQRDVLVLPRGVGRAITVRAGEHDHRLPARHVGPAAGVGDAVVPGDLRHVARGVDLIVQYHERALVSRCRISGDAHAFKQIGGAFVADRARITHRANEDHRPRIAHRQMEEERGFLERVRAAGDDDPRHFLVRREDFVDALRQREPLGK